MAEVTIFVDQTGAGLQQFEQFLTQMDGVERVLADTSDGEIRIEYDEEKISGSQIIGSTQKQYFQY